MPPCTHALLSVNLCSEHLGIPEAEYDATVKLPSSEFQRIVKDLASIGDTGGFQVASQG